MKRITRYTNPLLIALILLNAQIGFSKIIFVDNSKSAAGNGQTWATAYRFLQDGLTDAGTSDEIWVAAGTYKPDQSEAYPSGTGVREDTFILKNGVRLYGGLAGTEDPAIYDLNKRDFDTNPTILCGDLLEDDNNTLTAADLLTDPNRADNSYHVLLGTGITDTTVIDGFTITGGTANGTDGDDKGGGLLNSNNCNPQILNCLFVRNTAAWGAALYNYRSSNRIENCSFTDNASMASGGAIHNGTSLLTMEITNSIFENNFSEGSGGAIYNNNNAMMNISHCRMVNNKVWKYGNAAGGAITNLNNSQMTGTFCTFAGNISQKEGGAIRNDNSTLSLDHCILWDNEDNSGTALTAQYYNINGTVTIDYTCVMDWDPQVGGTGNFGTDPLFVDLPATDVHVQSQAGHWDTSTQTWQMDTQTSPCIDAGDPALWIADEPLGNGGRINIGCYAGTTEASRTNQCTGGFDGKGLLLADANRDCKVNMADFALLASEWMISTVE